MPKNKLTFKEKILGKVATATIERVYDYLVYCKEEGFEPNLESLEEFVQGLNDFMKEGKN